MYNISNVLYLEDLQWLIFAFKETPTLKVKEEPLCYEFEYVLIIIKKNNARLILTSTVIEVNKRA